MAGVKNKPGISDGYISYYRGTGLEVGVGEEGRSAILVLDHYPTKNKEVRVEDD